MQFYRGRTPFGAAVFGVLIVAGGLSASADKAYACDAPILGLYEVSARQFLPFGPNWSFSVMPSGDSRFDVELLERKIKFTDLELDGLELRGQSEGGGDKITIIFDIPSGGILGSISIRGEIPPFRFDGGPASQRAFDGRLEAFEKCAGYVFGGSPGNRIESVEVINLRSQTNLLQRENDTLRESIANERESFRAERELRSREVERFQQDLEEAKQQNISVRRELQAARESAEQKVQQANAQLASCREARESSDLHFKQKIDALEARIGEQSGNTGPLTAQLRSEKAALEVNNAELRAENTTLRSHLDALRSEGNTPSTELLKEIYEARQAVQQCQVDLDAVLTSAEGG
jgi:DNA repair exonuclease SbcCD ATPase subunit